MMGVGKHVTRDFTCGGHSKHVILHVVDTVNTWHMGLHMILHVAGGDGVN